MLQHNNNNNEQSSAPPASQRPGPGWGPNGQRGKSTTTATNELMVVVLLPRAKSSVSRCHLCPWKR